MKSFKFSALAIFLSSSLCLYFIGRPKPIETHDEQLKIISDDLEDFSKEKAIIRFIESQKVCQTVISYKPEFFSIADRLCTEINGTIADAPFEVGLKSRKLPAEAFSVKCFWTTGNVTKNGEYVGPAIYENAALDKFDEIKRFVEEELNVLGFVTGDLCLSKPVSSFLFSKGEEDQMSANFFCENTLFDNDGRLVMFHGKPDFCEHLQLNKSFILEHHLFDSDFLGESFVIVNLHEPNQSWIPFWSNFKSGWKANENVDGSEMPFCLEEPEAYHVQYCLPEGESGRWSVQMTTSKTQTASTVCVNSDLTAPCE